MITMPPPEGAALDAAITPIRRAVLEQTVARRRNRSRWTFGALGTVAAVTVTATVLVVGNVTGTSDSVPIVGSQPQAATAAEVLERAADVTVRTSDPVVAPGQFRKVEVQEASQAFFTSEMSALVPYSITVYQPADPTAQWTLVRDSGQPTQYFPAAKAAEAEAAWNRDPQGYPVETLHAAGGAFYGTPWTPAELAEMPRDPAALYGWVSDHAAGSASHEEAMTTLITDDLGTGMVPADLRSAMYQVLAKIPGTTITHDTVTLDGRKGIGIGRDEAARQGEHSEIVIDPQSGDFIGTRTLVGSGNPTLPEGTVFDSTAVTTTVVDSAP
ncbi:CU044_5270 family protein [Curtobacterium sp. CFBP9011]|uniref:CU044_5270 family protein n=1 Tax=Curtobacterium sp. CFBP9011 TaxID=3096530 RepID=UPI002A6A7BDC|nr:CU044_5270 family protein [Curtobacterium sp. CFBP9011]